MSVALTEGIRVVVASRYLEEHSSPKEGRFVFTYKVSISNEGESAAQLVARHWVITDAQGKVEEVQGPGVVGETPHLEPGDEHAYQSFCVLQTPRGTMHGSYQMVRTDGSTFDAEIAPFVLMTPGEDSKRVLN